MLAKTLLSLALDVSVQGFAPIAPSAATTRTSTSLEYQVTLVSDKEGFETQTIECSPDVFILDAAEMLGVQTQFSCRAAACSSSAGLLVDGVINQSVQILMDDEKVDKGWLLTHVVL